MALRRAWRRLGLVVSAAPRTVDLDLAAAGLEGRRFVTLLSSPAAIADVAAGVALTLPPYAAWVAGVRVESLEEDEGESRPP